MILINNPSSFSIFTLTCSKEGFFLSTKFLPLSAYPIRRPPQFMVANSGVNSQILSCVIGVSLCMCKN